LDGEPQGDDAELVASSASSGESENGDLNDDRGGGAQVLAERRKRGRGRRKE
jgi:hypothetical protein